MGSMDKINEKTLVDAIVHLVNKRLQDIVKTVKLGVLTPRNRYSLIVPALKLCWEMPISQKVYFF